MTNDLHRETRRLRRLFRRAVWLAIAAPAAAGGSMACGSSGGQGHGGASSSPSNASSIASTSAGTTTSSGAAQSSVAASSGSGSTTATTGGAGGAGGGGPCDPVSFLPMPEDPCGNYLRLPCGIPAGVMPAGACYFTLSDCSKFCPDPLFNCHTVNTSCVNGMVVPEADGSIEVDCATCAGSVGRVPAGLARATMRRARSVAGDYFAKASHLEAASVHAFDRLARELRAHDAPSRLVLAARRARRDEVRHARITARLAQRFGGAPPAAKVRRLPARTLLAVAAENAAEGCVREAFGALVATWQAERAIDPEVRRALGAIARDETRHAALSWSVAAWSWQRLDPRARGRVISRFEAALASLKQGASGPDDPATLDVTGLPNREQSDALVVALEAIARRRFDEVRAV